MEDDDLAWSKDSNNIVAAPNAAGEFPKALTGISVDLVQGNPPKVTGVPLRALYQSQCIPTGACAPLTGITLQVPFELETDPSSISFPIFRVTDNGKPAGGVGLRPIADNVHVLNLCDDTQTFVSAAYSVPQDVCASVVMGQNKLNSLYNLAHGGEELAMWVYGMGAKTEQAANCCMTPEQLSKPVQTFMLNFDFRANAPASPAIAGIGLTGTPNFAVYVGGLYQVNFRLPAVPADVPRCDTRLLEGRVNQH